MQAKRLDLGADVVVLPERDLIVFHPDLDYAESLGAVMGTLPDLHPDAAVGLVEQVTPRPRPEPEPKAPSTWRRAAAVLALAGAMIWAPAAAPPAVAGAEFGPNWKAAVDSLGMWCNGGGGRERTCHTSTGQRIRMRGYRHEDGSLYVTVGADRRTYVIFVFDRLERADRYAENHPGAIQQGRAVVW